MSANEWLSGRVLDLRQRGHRFKPHQLHCVVVLARHIYPSLVLVQPRKTRPCLTERLLMGHKESNQSMSANNFCKQFDSDKDVSPDLDPNSLTL